MKYRIVRIEMKDDENVLLYLKMVSKKPEFMPQPDLSDPARLLEFSVQMGMAAARKMEELMQFDAFITVSYEHYSMNDLKVGDIVEVDVRAVER